MDDGKTGAERVAHSAGPLLQDVRQLVAEELLAGGAASCLHSEDRDWPLTHQGPTPAAARHPDVEVLKALYQNDDPRRRYVK